MCSFLHFGNKNIIFHRSQHHTILQYIYVMLIFINNVRKHRMRWETIKCTLKIPLKWTDLPSAVIFSVESSLNLEILCMRVNVSAANVV